MRLVTINRNKVSINVDSPQKSIDPMIYSNFIEHLGECIHNGLWTYDPVNVPLIKGNPFLVGVRKDILESVKDLKVSVLRAFGGCYSDVYHWKDAIGPRESRKIVKNKQWARFPISIFKGLGPKIENQFGTDEFCHFCEAIGAEPYLNINYSTGTPEEAAQWVEYCNGSVNTEYGALRAKNGREKPYNIKFWGIANEIWGRQEVGRERHPENYAKRYLLFAKAMREKDSNIKLVAVGWVKSAWNQAVLEGIGEEWVDYLSVHQYVPLPLKLSTIVGKKRKTTEESYYSLMTAARLIEKVINDTWEDITTILGKNSRVRIAFDEWGVWEKMRQIVKTNYYLQDGLCTSDMLLTFQRMSDKCPMANWAQLINCIGTIRTDLDGLILTPVYLAFKLFVDHTYNKIITGLDIECETFDSNKFGCIPKTNNVPYIECNATINNEGDKLSIMLINKHFTDDLNVELEINRFVPKEQGNIIELNSQSPFDYNTIENRNKIKLKQKKIGNIKPKMMIKLPEHSVIVLKLNKK